MQAEALLRPGETGDIAALVSIYNYYVVETHITFDTRPFTVGSRTQWFSVFGQTGPYRLFIAEVGGTVIGYASSTRFKEKAAYARSVETTIYLDPDWTGKGIGARLYAKLLDALEAEPKVHRAYGGVALPNPASIALHEALGFEKVATYHEVGYKFDRYYDVCWFEKALESS